jgi:hypothetical protein
LFFYGRMSPSSAVRSASDGLDQIGPWSAYRSTRPTGTFCRKAPGFFCIARIPFRSTKSFTIRSFLLCFKP